jgi:hypothetical protein
VIKLIRPKFAMMWTAALVAVLALLTGCAEIKPLARTAVEAARHACAAYAEQTGVSFEDVCKTEEQLRPFIDALLAAQQAAAAQAAAGATGDCKCPECPAAPEAAPEPKPAPEAPPAPATGTPEAAPAPAAPAPAPEKK